MGVGVGDGAGVTTGVGDVPDEPPEPPQELSATPLNNANNTLFFIASPRRNFLPTILKLQKKETQASGAGSYVVGATIEA